MSNIIAATILALGLVLAAFLHTGRYYGVAVGGGDMVRIDRWTGKTTTFSKEYGKEWWRDHE